MTDAERQQLKRDRRKAGLVLVQAWVPKSKFETVFKAIDRMLADDASVVALSDSGSVVTVL